MNHDNICATIKELLKFVQFLGEKRQKRGYPFRNPSQFERRVIMPLIFCLVDILTQFRPLFNRQNFALFVPSLSVSSRTAIVRR